MVGRELGMRIRALREERGITQEDFAHGVFVARQTVSNWERGRTLPDVESLKLIAGFFGITVDELIDADVQRMIDETADARHTLIVWIVSSAIYFLALVVEAAVGASAQRVLSTVDLRGIELVTGILRLILLAWFCVCAFRAQRVRRDRDLATALEIVAFIEGRRPGTPLPDTVLYRWILPYFSFWWAAFSVIVCALFVVTLAWDGGVVLTGA